MTSSAYYNENDPFAAAWLRELISNNLIAPGDVDERSIEDVTANEIKSYTQHHFFAGIGGWSLALRCAGWPDNRPIWTGSCPCQPFSAAGKGGGFTDERHLWPAFFHLIEECKPTIIVGEQVASKDGLAWLDLVQTDLEAASYSFGAVDTCAAGFGAPHIRQRLYWVADADSGAGGQGRSILEGGDNRSDAKPRPGLGGGGSVGKLANQARLRLPSEGCGQDRHEQPSQTNGLWRDADWLYCRDGRWRSVEPGTFPLADAGSIRNRVGALRGSGNAINLAQAKGFLEAVIETIGDSR